MKKMIVFLIALLISIPMIMSDDVVYCGIEVTPKITQKEMYAGQTNVIGSFIVINTTDHEQEIKINPLIEQIEEEYRLPNPRMIFTDVSHFWLKVGEEREIFVLIGIPRGEKYEFKQYKTGLEVTAEYKNRAVAVIVAVEIELFENKYTIEDYELIEDENALLKDKNSTLENCLFILSVVSCVIVCILVIELLRKRKLLKGGEQQLN